MTISNDEILKVSLTLFSQNGYDGTSLQDIADCLNVTKGALFKHYEGKEALWNALIDKVEVYYGEHFGRVKKTSPRYALRTAQITPSSGRFSPIRRDGEKGSQVVDTQTIPR